MNTTTITNSVNNNEISTYIIIAFLVISELLPFIRKTKGGGFLHSIVCLLRGSQCVAKKIADEVEEFTNPEKDTNQESV